jgi:LacI family transcriptional regulator
VLIDSDQRERLVLSKATYAEVAKLATVGTATVERVLNGRGGVRPETVEKVLLAARALDWPGRLPEQHRGIIRIEVILVRPDTSFYARLARAFRRIATSLDPSIQIQLTFLQEDDPQAIANRILNPPMRRSGLAVVCPAYDEVAAALAQVRLTGLPIVQIVSRIVEDLDFVGIDNVAAGRLAAMMVSRLSDVRGTVVALCHSQIYGVHRDRIRGFSDYMDAKATDGLSFNLVAFGHDEQDMSARRMAEAIRDWPDLAAVYNSGGANSSVLRELRRAKKKVFFVGHELTDVTRAALSDGIADVIFDQAPEAQARRTTDLLLSKIGLLTEIVENPPVRFITITSENL